MQSFPPTSSDTYKALARTWAATVTVVTARRKPEHVIDKVPELDGFTATAFLTVSISPPIILVSATQSSSASTMLRECVGFAVNLLTPEQADLAGAFARPAAERAALWDHLKWQPDEAGTPLLGGTTGAFSARVREMVEAGDHVLVLGDVTGLHLGEGADTLVYHNRAYGRVARIG